jgi:hypothetical protein
VELALKTDRNLSQIAHRLGINGNKEDERDEHDGVKAFNACGGEAVEPKL